MSAPKWMLFVDLQIHERVQAITRRWNSESADGATAPDIARYALRLGLEELGLERRADVEQPSEPKPRVVIVDIGGSVRRSPRGWGSA